MLNTEERIKIYLSQLDYKVQHMSTDTDWLYLLIENHKWYKEIVDRECAAESGFVKRFGWLPQKIQAWLQGR